MHRRIKKMLILAALAVAALIVSLPAGAATQRLALVIGNSAYETGPLANPVNDAADMAASLTRMGFTVILKKNANLEAMEEAIENFGGRLKRGGVGLFYYAGHGIQAGGTNYLIPVGAKIKKESDLRYRAVDAGRILDEMQNAENGMNIVILDACRDNPFNRSFRSATRGLSIISAAPKGTFLTYSTSPGNVAADGRGRNSPYTEALLRHMGTPGLPIEHVFKRVRQDLAARTGGRQIPWELSSLSGDFYFRGGPEASVEAPPADNSVAAAALEEERRKLAEERERLRKEDEERRKLAEERERLRKETELAEARRKIEEERKKLEEERQRLASLPKPDPAGGARHIASMNAKVTAVKLFESPYTAPPKEQRSYRTSFSRTNTRYVVWELNLSFPAQGQRKDFAVEHIWFNPHGTEIFRSVFNGYVLGDWTWSYHNTGYGWREVSNTTWIAGRYRVDLYVDGVKIASEFFTMY
ncbi:MAG: caspase domain-containing protein [Smithellaceae bacterium]|nr:caspase family protein [Syntrophaceae bacterium]MDD4240611.1 caspase domain-containing protein [Smithellaceae bacterium]NLX52055.1 hypothetical protein [Deltaproteobacteria bacterium]